MFDRYRLFRVCSSRDLTCDGPSLFFVVSRVLCLCVLWGCGWLWLYNFVVF